MQADKNDFFQKVYALVKQIPPGKVTTYGAIARALGMARSARMVGYAMNASHSLSDVPAHRVVNKNGFLTGKHHFQGTTLMQELLENEGICVANNQINTMKMFYWEPPVAKECSSDKAIF